MNQQQMESQLAALRREFAALQASSAAAPRQRLRDCGAAVLCVLLGVLGARLAFGTSAAPKQVPVQEPAPAPVQVQAPAPVPEPPLKPAQEPVKNEALDLSCRSLKIVDTAGKPRLEMGLKDDRVRLAVLNAQGVPQLVLGLSAHGGLLQLCGADGVERGVVGITPEGSVMLALSAQDARPRLFFEVAKDGQGLILVKSQHSKAQLVAACDDAGGRLSLHDTAGERLVLAAGGKVPGSYLAFKDTADKNRLLLAADDQGGTVNLFGSSSKRHAFLSSGTGDNGGLLTLYTAEERPAIILDNKKDSSFLSLHNPKGQRLSYVGAHPEGGRCHINGPEGKPRLVLDIDKDGLGSFDIIDKNGHSLLMLSSDKEGGMLGILAAERKERVFLGIAEKTSAGQLILIGEDGKKRLLLDGTTGK